MGLDMYLNKKYYVQNWEHTPEENRHHITILKGGKPSIIPVSKIAYIETEEIKWRKANAIHGWFVDNVQDGVDECQPSRVDEEHLKELLALVNEVLVDHSKAPELLPPREGFFFSTTGIDSWYWKDLEFTKKELERVLEENKLEEEQKVFGEFIYQSSW